MKQFIFLALWSFCFQLSYAQDSAAVSIPKANDSVSVSSLQNDSVAVSSSKLTDSISKSATSDSVAVSNLQTTDSSHTFKLNEEPTATRITQSVYSTSFKRDAPIIIAGVGLSYLGLKLIQNKKALTEAEVLLKSKNDVPSFDRNSSGWYSKKYNHDSYTPFYISFGIPIVMMLTKNESSKAGQIFVMYTETMAITGTLFTITAGLVDRSRPLVYGTIAPLSVRMSKNSQRSFFAGHTAGSAAATFFAAKVFQDFNPDSKARVFVWAVSAAIPAVVGYMRYKAGMHFLSDNIVGYIVGAATGILVPEFHKSKSLKNVSLAPEIGANYKGIAMTYHF